MRLKNFTTKDCACLITLRNMGNYFLGKEDCKKRTLLDAREFYIGYLPEIISHIAIFDAAELQQNSIRPPAANPAQPITNVREDNSSWLTKPSQAFTVTATSTWSEIISNVSE